MTDNTAQNEFIQAHNGVLTPEQAAQLLSMGLQGDSSDALQPGGEPAASAATGDDSTTAGAASNDTNTGVTAEGDGSPAVELDSTNAVILAKDGKHRISYDKLVEAREGERRALQKLQAVQQELDRLKSEAQQRVDAGLAPTAIDNQLTAAQAAVDAGVTDLVALFGDYSEEEMAKGVSELVDKRVSAAVAKALAPLQAKEASNATEQHYQAIYEKHPDADSIYESKELTDWVAAQPSFVRAGYQAVLQQGSTQEIIELFDSFKQATGSTQAATDTPPVDVKEAAKKAIANTPAPVPHSLSDFPGGRAGADNREEAMADLSGPDLLAAMQNMKPDQIETFLNRRV